MERAITSPLKITVAINTPVSIGTSAHTSRVVLNDIGNVVEHEHTGTLEIQDRYGVAIRKIARGFWSSYDIISYETPGDHVQVPE